MLRCTHSHFLIDYYYYATAGGAKIWWKKYLTSMQITQFIIDIVIIYYAGSLTISLICRDLSTHQFSWLQRTTSSSPRLALAPTPRLCPAPPSLPPTSTSSSTSTSELTSPELLRRLRRRLRLSEPRLISIRGVNAAPSCYQCPRRHHAALPDITAVFHHLVAFSNLSPFLHHTRTHNTHHITRSSFFAVIILTVDNLFALTPVVVVAGSPAVVTFPSTFH